MWKYTLFLYMLLTGINPWFQTLDCIYEMETQVFSPETENGVDMVQRPVYG